jgi:hypothetical protein
MFGYWFGNRLSRDSNGGAIRLRGFLVLFDAQPALERSQPDGVEQRLASWRAKLDPKNLREESFPNCHFYLYSHSRGSVMPELNQKLRRDADGIALWAGSRIDLTDDALLRPLPEEPTASVDAVRASPGALDTAVCVRYHEISHTLLVKTDIINSTFVYWTRAGRWVLVSNSSLTLARVTGATVDWVSASEFLASGSIYGNRSLYESIGTFKPAALYSFTNGGVPAERQYWHLPQLPFNTLSARDACASVVSGLDRDFEALNATGKGFVLDLTGGYDSRTNLGFALRKLENFETTVLGMPGDEDVVISSTLARHFGVKHTVVSPLEEYTTLESRLADSVLLTDLEYDLIEYARIYRVQSQSDTLRQASIHGSGGGDIARNIILRPEFCDPNPEGKVILETLINSRFKCAIPTAWSRPDVPIADWQNHMRAQIAEYDAPELPAFARLDILYLRMRMQFWQSRIASSTNRFRTSFSPWTNRDVLETMLTTRWRERQRQMLSRLFLKALHRDLTRFVVARGEPGGPSLWSALVAAPARLRYYASRVAIRLGRPAARSYVEPERFRHFVPQWQENLANILRPEAVDKLTLEGPTVPAPNVIGRLVTLAHVKDAVK